MLDNTFMSKKIKKRKSNKEINDFIDNLTDEEKKIIIREHIKRNEKEKDNAQYDDFSMSKISFIKNIHRTTLYKNQNKEIINLIERRKLLKRPSLKIIKFMVQKDFLKHLSPKVWQSMIEHLEGI